jgi:lipoprotein-releasing system permease protein
MFQPVPIFVGLRYSVPRDHGFFVSFITWVSLLGVAAGVAAIIVVLSVMNGFESELRSRLLSVAAHARLINGGSVSTIADSIREGNLRDLLPGLNRMILGRVLAYQLQVGVGDSVTAMIPGNTDMGGGVPRLQEFQVVGTFEVGSK